MSELFLTKSGELISRITFEKTLKRFSLTGKCVLVYSRLISFGRLTGKRAVEEIIEVLQESVGREGTLCIPAYTFSAYNKEVFDSEKSKSTTGILGEVAREMRCFRRTIHPIYSTLVWGRHTDFLLEQSSTTCFGKNSFFDRFSSLPNAYILMLGLNFNGPTFYHYYDQRFHAPGRFIKEFEGHLVVEGKEVPITFDSYVKDYDFYRGRMNCMARFDAAATYFGVVERCPFGDDWIHGIHEIDYRNLYKACIAVAPEYFLFGSQEEWEEYYLKGKFTLMHNTLDTNMLLLLEQEIKRCGK